MKVLIDTNVLLDYLSFREPNFGAAKKIVDLCISGEIKATMAAHSITNFFYILRKEYSYLDRKKLLLNLCDIVDVECVDETKIINALSREQFDDIEDCLQDECAYACDARYIITRDVNGFKESNVEAILPEDFLKIVDNRDDMKE